MIDFQTDPSRYRHWRVEYDGAVATLFMDVDEQGGLFDGYELKLNSYDLGVDIELADVIQRMRFEHPEVSAIVLASGKSNVFCAGANIRMLGGADHAHKVNFCKFTNETRNAMEAAAVDSAQHYIAAIRGACAGGGYELALACNEIVMTDDGSTSVALPEVPLLAVLPGTGGLTRVTDKRKVRRDLADVFCTVEEGVKGKRAEQWKLVDKVVANSAFEKYIQERAQSVAHEVCEQAAAKAGMTAHEYKQTPAQGITLAPLHKSISDEGNVSYQYVEVIVDRQLGTATITLKASEDPAPATTDTLHQQGDASWLLRTARELDDAILHLRFNELELGVLLLRTEGSVENVLEHERFLLETQSGDWLAREILQYWKRVLKRVDLTSRTLVALVENGSCFAGVLAELAFAADRSYMMDGEFDDIDSAEATLVLSAANFGMFPMSNDLGRLQTRFADDQDHVNALERMSGQVLDAQAAMAHGLVTYAYDDIDWEDEIRVFLEERGSFSPDALTGMEANLRFAGVETMETRIFGRLTAWQNWIFQRPNAVSETGALQRYGTGKRGEFDKRRV